MNIRFPEDIYKKYKELSKNTGHSFNGLVISAMHYALDNMEYTHTRDVPAVQVLHCVILPYLHGTWFQFHADNSFSCR